MTRSPSSADRGADRGADRPLDVAVIGTRGYPSYYGGFETAVRHLAPWLAERGWGVTVYGRPGSTAPADPARDRRVVSRLTRGVESKSLSTLSYGFTAVADAVRRRPDVALVMNVANGFWIPLPASAASPSWSTSTGSSGSARNGAVRHVPCSGPAPS